MTGYMKEIYSDVLRTDIKQEKLLQVNYQYPIKEVTSQASINQCASNIFPISFESETCTDNCDIIGKGIVYLTDRTFAVYGSANKGQSFIEQKQDKSRHAVIIAMDTIGIVQWGKQISVTDGNNEIVAAENISQLFFICIQSELPESPIIADRQNSKQAILELTINGVFKQSSKLSINTVLPQHYISSINSMKFVPNKFLQLSGKVYDPNVQTEVGIDIIIQVTNKFILVGYNKHSFQDPVIKASSEISYQFSDNTVIAIKQYIQSDKKTIRVTLYSLSGNQLTLKWQQDQEVETATLTIDNDIKSVQCTSIGEDKFLVFVPSSHQNNKDLTIFEYKIDGSSVAQKQKLQFSTEGTARDIIKLNAQTYKQEDNYNAILMLQVEDVQGFQLIVLNTQDYSILKKKQVGLEVASVFGSYFVQTASEEVFYYMNVNNFALSEPYQNSATQTLIIGRLELAHPIDIGLYDCSRQTSLITVESIPGSEPAYNTFDTVVGGYVELTELMDVALFLSIWELEQEGIPKIIPMMINANHPNNAQQCAGGVAISNLPQVEITSSNVEESGTSAVAEGQFEDMTQCQGLASSNAEISFDNVNYQWESEYGPCYQKQGSQIEFRYDLCEPVPSYRQFLLEYCLDDYSDICQTSISSFQMQGVEVADKIDLAYQCNRLSDKTFPKVLGSDVENMEVYGSTFMENSNSIVTCGQMDADLYKNKNYYKDDQKVAFIMKANVNGKIHWMHSGKHIYSSDSKFVSCGTNYDNVFALLWMDSPDLEKYAMINIDPESGRIIQTVQLPFQQVSDSSVGLAFEYSNVFVLQRNKGNDKIQFNLLSVFQELQWQLTIEHTKAIVNSQSKILRSGGSIFVINQIQDADNVILNLYQIDKVSGEVEKSFELKSVVSDQLFSGKFNQQSISSYGDTLMISAIFQDSLVDDVATFSKLLLIGSLNQDDLVDTYKKSTITITEADNMNFITDVYFNSESIIDVFYQQTSNDIHFISYQRSDLSTFTVKRIHLVGIDIKFLQVFLRRDFTQEPFLFYDKPYPFYTVYSAKSYLSASKYSMVINQFSEDLTTTSCTSFTDKLEQIQDPVVVQGLTFSPITSIIDLTVLPTLELQSGLYFERKYQYTDIQFKRAQNIESCDNEVTFTTFEDLSPKSITVGGSSISFTINKPTICSDGYFDVMVFVNGEAENPSWIDIQDEVSAITISIGGEGFEVTEDDIGLYSIQISQGNTDTKLYQYVAIEIKGTEQLDYEVIENTCESNKDYQFYFGTSDDKVVMGDLTQNGLQLICGESLGNNGWIDGQNNIFFQLYTNFDYLVFHKSIRVSNQYDNFIKCQFDSSNNIWIAMESNNQGQQSQITILQYDVLGNYLQGKQFSLSQNRMSLISIDIVGDQLFVVGADSDQQEVLTFYKFKLTNLDIISIHQMYIPEPIQQDGRLLNDKDISNDTKKRNLLNYHSLSLQYIQHYIDIPTKNVYAIGQKVETLSPALFSYNLESFDINWEIYQQDPSQDNVFNLADHSQNDIQVNDKLLYTCILTERNSFGVIHKEATISKRGNALPNDGDTFVTYDHIASRILTFGEDYQIQSCQFTFQDNRILVGLQVQIDDGFTFRIYNQDLTFADSIKNALSLNNLKQSQFTHKPLYQMKFVNTNGVISFYKQWESILEDQNIKLSLTRMKFKISSESSELEWTDSNCEYLQSIEVGQQFGDDTNTYSDMWVDGEQLRFTELPLNYYDDSFKTPKYLYQKTFTASTVKDIRGSYIDVEDSEKVCHSLQDIKIATQASKYDYIDGDSKQYSGAYFEFDVNTYSQCQGLIVLTDYEVVDGDFQDSSHYSYNKNTNKIRFYPEENPTDQKNYVFTQKAFLVDDTQVSLVTQEYTVEVTQNDQPLLQTQDDLTPSKYSYQLSKTWTFKILNDDDSPLGTAIEIKDGVDNSMEPLPEWVQVSQVGDDKKFTVTIFGHEQPSEDTTYTIKVIATDGVHNQDISTAIQTIVITLTNNRVPRLRLGDSSLDLAYIKPGSYKEAIILKNSFIDDDVEAETNAYMSVKCNSEVPWLEVDEGVQGSQQYIVQINTPETGIQDGDVYDIICIAEDFLDIEDQTPLDSITFKFKVTITTTNETPFWSSYDYIHTALVDYEYYFSDINSCNDLEDDSITYKYYYNFDEEITETSESQDHPFYIKVDEIHTAPTLYFNNDKDFKAGNYEIRVTCTDGQVGHKPMQSFYKFVFEENSNPVPANQDTLRQTVFFKDTSLTISDVHELFTDANPAHVNKLKYYISSSDSNKTDNPIYISYLSGDYATKDASNNIQFTFVGQQGFDTYYLFAEDLRGQLAYKQFDLTVQGCDQTCNDCNGPSDDQCIDCLDNENYDKVVVDQSNYQCNIQCGTGRYPDSPISCDTCGDYCSSCKGPSNTLDQNNCQECKSTAFNNDGVCVEECPSTKTYLEEDHICIAAVMSTIAYSGIETSKNVRIAESGSIDYTIQNPQLSITVQFSYKVFAGIGIGVNRQTDISGQKTWINGTSEDETFTLSFVSVPNVNTAGINDQYTIEITIQNSAGLISTFDLELTNVANRAPEKKAATSLTLPDQIVGKYVSFKILKSWFEDQDGDSFTLNYCSSAVSQLAFTPSNGDIVVTGNLPKQNSYAASYSTICTLQDQHLKNGTVAFTLTVIENEAPYVVNQPTDVTIQYGTTQDFYVYDIFEDPEVDDLVYTVKVDGTTISNDTDSMYKYYPITQVFTITYNNFALHGDKSISIEASDGIDRLPLPLPDVAFVVTFPPNVKPTKKDDVSLTLTSQRVYQEITGITIELDFFEDVENDQMTLDCDFVIAIDNISIDKVNGDFVVSGKTDPQNAYAGGPYEILCTIEDDYDSNEYTFEFSIQENQAPVVVKPLGDDSVTYGNTFSRVLTDTCTDPEGDIITYHVCIEDVEITDDGDSKFSFDPLTNTLTFNYDDIEGFGSFNIKVICVDPITDRQNSTEVEFTLEAIENQPPQIKTGIPDTLASQVVGVSFKLPIEKVWFEDIDGDQFSIHNCQVKDAEFLDWFSFDTDDTDYEITGQSPKSNDFVGTYEIECTIEDINNLSDDYTFKIPITANPIPTIANIPPSSNVKYGSKYTYDFSNVCLDENDDELTYKVFIGEDEVANDPQEAFSFDQDTVTFVFNYNDFANQGPKPITVKCYDGINDQHNEVTYIITTELNNVPQILLPEYLTLPSQVVNVPINTLLTLGFFIDVEDDPMTLDCQVTTPEIDFISLQKDPTGDYVITGKTPANNSYSMQITIQCEISDEYGRDEYTFTLPIETNQAPTFTRTLEDVILLVGESSALNLNGLCSDAEGEDITYKLYIANVEIYDAYENSHYDMDGTVNKFTFNYPSVDKSGDYQVKVECKDTVVSNLNTKSYLISAQPNAAPNIIQSSYQTLPAQIVGKPISVYIQKNWFTDKEGDPFTLTCSIQTASVTSWLTSSSQVNGNTQLTGTSPLSNSQAITIEIKCRVAGAGNNGRDYTFSMDLNQNQPPVAQKPTDASLTINDVFTLDLTPICTDPESDNLVYSVKFDGTLVTDQGTQARFVQATNTFTYNYNSFANAGNHRVDVICSDSIDSRIVETFFSLALIPNQPPALKPGKSTTLDVQIIGKPILANVVHSDFQDPENDPFTLSCTHTSVEGITITYQTQGNGDMKITGTTGKTNSLVRDLTISCTVSDQYNDVPVSYILPIHANQPPTIANNPNDALLAITDSDSKSFNNICVDPEGDSLTYTIYFETYEIDDAYENEHFDYVSATNTFTYTYTDVSQNGNYVVTIKCFDGIDTRFAETSYYISASPNHAPYLIDANNKVLQAQTVGKSVSLKIFKSWFEDREGDVFTISCQIKTQSSQFLNISSNGDDYEITGTIPKYNNLASTQTVECIADDNNSDKKAEFTFVINENSLPYFVNPPTNENYKFPGPYTKTFIGACQDAEQDQLTYSMKVDNVDIPTTVGKYSFNQTTAIFTFNYDNIDSQGTHTVTVLCTDGIDNGRTAQTTYQFTALPNVAPTLKLSKSSNLPAQIVGRPISIDIYENWFEDVDEDDFDIACTIPSASASQWLNATKGGFIPKYKISGTSPKLNNLVGPYQVKCTAKDSNNFSKDQIFLMQLNANQAPSKPIIQDQTIYSTQSFTYVLTSGFIDPEGDILTCSAKVNDNAVSPSYLTDFTYNATTFTFKFDYQTDGNDGIYTIKLACTDGIDTNRQVETIFTINAIANAPPTVAQSISPINIDIFDTSYDLGILNQYFTDPEGLTMTFALTGQAGVPLPDIVTSFVEGLIEFNFSEQFTGTQSFTFILAATDSVGQKATIPFNITVQGCSSRCSSCTDTTSDTCTGCLDPYFLNINTCEEQCPDYTWADDNNNLCVECHEYCELCTGPDHYTECQTCAEDYFKHENGCSDRCPPNFYPDTNTYTCLPMEQSNTQSYVECQAFVTEMIQNGYVTDQWVMPFDEMVGTQVTCPSAYMCNGLENNPPVPCTWTRKFAMQCTRGVDGIASLRVATNSMPDHCVDTTAQFPEETFIDFEVSFNRQDKFGNITFKGIDDANKYRCANDWLKEFNMLHDYNYIGYGENSNVRDLIVGVAFNGVPIMSGVSEFGFDPFYPKRFGTNTNVRAIPVDDCLGYTGKNGFYHYYSVSPCILPSLFKNNNIVGELCSKTLTCLSDIVRYLTNQYPKPADFKVIQKVGIARDGHFIIGPYNTNGKLWQPCEVDVCNGVTIQNKYYYATTLFHPYTVGCFGKGSRNTYQQQCSTRALVCNDLTNSEGDGGAGSSAIYTLIPSLLQLGIVTILTLFISFM